MSSTHQIAPEVHVLGVALAPPAEEVRRAGADAAHVGAVARALHRVLDVALEKKRRFRLSRNLHRIYLCMQRNESITHRVSRLLAVALAHHLQVDDDGLVDAHRLDLEGLLPLAGVLWKEMIELNQLKVF